MQTIDFNKTAVNHFSVNLDQPTTLAHLAWAAEIMQWFNGKGKELLEAEYAHNRLVWESLFHQAFLLYRDFSETNSVKALLVQVVERGIADVTAIAKAIADIGQRDKPPVHDWIMFIGNYCLAPGSNAGLNGGACSEEKTHSMLIKLMEAAQIVQSSQLVIDIAGRMAPGNEMIQKLLVEHYVNW